MSLLEKLVVARDPSRSSAPRAHGEDGGRGGAMKEGSFSKPAEEDERDSARLMTLRRQMGTRGTGLIREGPYLTFAVHPVRATT